MVNEITSGSIIQISRDITVTDSALRITMTCFIHLMSQVREASRLFVLVSSPILLRDSDAFEFSRDSCDRFFNWQPFHAAGSKESMQTFAPFKHKSRIFWLRNRSAMTEHDNVVSDFPRRSLYGLNIFDTLFQ
jgi:hypothetical protein